MLNGIYVYHNKMIVIYDRFLLEVHIKLAGMIKPNFKLYINQNTQNFHE